ncbi:MAG: helix-turn-helix transcriptional regulator [Rhodospirillales bacterium]|nr:helix-turn-helix transcriptional regulator [Rhodospirillales bacterium]
MGKEERLQQFERVVLQALLQLGGDAYGMTIRREVARRNQRMVSIGSIYATLARLQQCGLVTSHPAAASPERGGRRRRCFRIQASGVRALHAANAATKATWIPVAMVGAQA